MSEYKQCVLPFLYNTYSSFLGNVCDSLEKPPQAVVVKHLPKDTLALLYEKLLTVVKKDNIEAEVFLPGGVSCLDFFLKDRGLALGVCCFDTHGEVSSGIAKSFNYDRMIFCYENGIRVMTIFEDELWAKPSIVIDRIRNASGFQKRNVFARKCVVRSIPSKKARDFIRVNHIQGPTGSNHCYGLFFGEELLQVMTFGALARAHTSLEGITIEMKRLCSKEGVSVVGGASKLFAHAKRELSSEGYEWVKSYCDMRYSNIFKPVYEVLGFTLKGLTKYTPHYFREGKRVRNQGLRKTEEERLTGKTEWELRRDEGYDRFYDCGHRTYIYKL